MKSKLIAPWKVTLKNKIVLKDERGNSRRYEIARIEKKIGRFTGKLIWTFYFRDAIGIDFATYHAKLNSLPVQKVLVEKIK